jgi:hypothetical protein
MYRLFGLIPLGPILVRGEPVQWPVRPVGSVAVVLDSPVFANDLGIDEVLEVLDVE